MKFTQKLGAHLTPEWRQQYISYADLKLMILNAVENDTLKEMTSLNIDSYYANFEEEFFFECDKQLRKVNTFYAEKLAEATRRNEVLVTALDDVIGELSLRKRTISRLSIHQKKGNTKPKNKKAQIQNLKNGYSELYLSLVLLQNYKMLNHTGFRKILKKHDKMLNTVEGKQWFDNHISSAFFFQNSELDKLIHEVEQNFTEYLENGNRTQAMKRLRVPRLVEIQDIGTVFRVGLFIGANIALLGFIFIATFTRKITSKIQSIYGLILFRGPFYVIIYLFLLGINVFSWRRAGINHILIFEINPRKHLTYSHLLELHGIFGVLWSLCVLGFIYAEDVNVPRYLFPLLLVAIMLCFLINPLPIFHQNARFWLLRLLGRVVSAPFFSVGFADFWLGDQLNSMVACLIDFKYLFCFYIWNSTWSEDFEPNLCLESDYIGNAIIRSLPAWYRFAQCLRRYRDTDMAYPFLVNAGKYASSFPVIIFTTLTSIYKDSYDNTFQNPFMWCYLVAVTFQTFYCYFWDILRDFGLFQTFSNKHIFLREHIIYPAAFYYFVVIENFFLRFFWAISLYMVNANYISSFNVDSLAGCLEIFRRYIWNYIRLENEHLFNVGQFRAVRDIFIAPIDLKSSIEIQKMMDEEDGVKNRTKYKYREDSIKDNDDDVDDEDYKVD